MKKVKLTVIEKIGLVLSLIGLILIFQPVSLEAFTYGYYIMALGALIFILSGYFPVKTEFGETTLKDIIKWIAIVACVLFFVITLSIYLAPYVIVR